MDYLENRHHEKHVKYGIHFYELATKIEVLLEGEMIMDDKEEFLQILEDAWDVLMKADKKMNECDFLSDELKDEFTQIRLELSKFYADAM